MAAQENNGRHLWIGVGKQILSFAIGVIVAAFVLGTARQKVADLNKWKDDTAPRIERMDRDGTISFSHFHKEYEKQQTRQDAERKDLEHRVRELEKKNP